MTSLKEGTRQIWASKSVNTDHDVGAASSHGQDRSEITCQEGWISRWHANIKSIWHECAYRSILRVLHTASAVVLLTKICIIYGSHKCATGIAVVYQDQEWALPELRSSSDVFGLHADQTHAHEEIKVPHIHHEQRDLSVWMGGQREWTREQGWT